MPDQIVFVVTWPEMRFVAPRTLAGERRVASRKRTKAGPFPGKKRMTYSLVDSSLKGKARLARRAIKTVGQSPSYRSASSLRDVALYQRVSPWFTLCRLEIGDTADWKSALL